MTFLDTLRSTLREDEGVRTHIYCDHLGNRTIGVGHLIRDDDPEAHLPIGFQVTEERVGELFERDIKTCLDDCRWLHADFDKLPDAAKVVLASMSFQLGLNGFSGFRRFHAAIRKRDWEQAEVEMLDSKWAQIDTPARAHRLAQRIIKLAQ